MRPDFPLDFNPTHQAPDLDGTPSLMFAFRRHELLVTDAYELPSESAFIPVRTQYLGTLNGRHCASAELPSDFVAPAGHRLRDLRRLYGKLDKALHRVAGRAVQIMEWDRSHQFCGTCAGPTKLSNRDRSRQGPDCKIPLYPRLSPAMIVAVERDRQILLARSAHFPPGIFSVLAGFVEPGESAEDAVIREVYEETRIVVDNVQYFGSQPWPFPNSLMLGFTAQYRSGELDITKDELVDAGWFDVDELPPTFPGKISISQWLLHDFVRRHTGA